MERYDVVVVGAGPAGARAASASASAGARTLLVDRREELGHPVQCGEFVPTPEELGTLFDAPALIREAFWIPDGTALRATHTMVCVSPFGHRYRFPLAGFTLSRRAFDKALALDAEGRGAELRFPWGVTQVRGSEVVFARGDPVEAKVVIAADGPVSTVARSVGFHPDREMYRMVTATVDQAWDDEIDIYFGHLAPGGYAWAFPRRDDANVGIGVTHLPRGVGLDQLLDRFVRSQGLPPAHDRTHWWVPIGPPPETLVAGSTLITGDAANLVMATNGGGIPTAMLSGWLAGEAAAAHVLERVPLAEYDHAWKGVLAPVLARGHAIKRFGDRWASRDPLLALGMRYIGARGLDAMMRMQWPVGIGRNR
jgi:digeranylgeranylglycerophospholipid reductase